jgi:hypothetical protein
MAKNKSDLNSVATNLNLISAVVTLSSNTEKTMDFSSYKNKELLKSTKNILLKQKLNGHK